MTTIAYNHKDGQIAVDSRVTSGGLIETDNDDKRVSRGDVQYYMAGAMADTTEFIDAHISGDSVGDMDCAAIVVKDGRVYDLYVLKGKVREVELKYNAALGSGSSFAIAAMDHGKSAKDAVKYAATRNIYTGGRVRVFDVKCVR